MNIRKARIGAQGMQGMVPEVQTISRQMFGCRPTVYIEKQDTDLP